MKTLNLDFVRCIAFISLLVAPAACDPDDPGADEVADDEGDRAPLGKADQMAGSCEGHCGEQSDDICWCDESCVEFGDCCSDYAQVCDAPDTCDGPNPAGCGSDDDCATGETCVVDPDACISSACGCEGGVWQCTADCSGGTCEPAPEPEPECDGPNPAGCGSDDDCATGETCVVDPDACISSACGCEGGVWQCTADCNGGVCESEDGGGESGGEGACADPNPADTCISQSDCIPSGCDCADGVWQCTPDCSGGLDC